MQELLSEISHPNWDRLSFDARYKMFDKLLDLEKEQIMKAFLEGKVNHSKDWSIEYYNQTYNQELEKEYQPSEKYLKKQRELMEDFIWNKNNQNK